MSTAMDHALTPCACRLSHDAAVSCPRERRGTLRWTPVDLPEYPDFGGSPLGAMEVEDLEGNRSPFTLDNRVLAACRALAEDYARIRHLDFEEVRA